MQLQHPTEWEIARLAKYFLHGLPSAEWRDHLQQAMRFLANPNFRAFNVMKPRAPIWAVDSEEPLPAEADRLEMLAQIIEVHVGEPGNFVRMTLALYQKLGKFHNDPLFTYQELRNWVSREKMRYRGIFSNAHYERWVQKEREERARMQTDAIETAMAFAAPLRGRTLEQARRHNPGVPDLENRWKSQLTFERKRKALSQQATLVYLRPEPPLPAFPPFAIEELTEEEKANKAEWEAENAELMSNFRAAGRAWINHLKRQRFV